MTSKSTKAQGRQRDGGLGQAVEIAVREFMETLDGEGTTDFYNLFLSEVEEPLLRVVLEYCGGNQSRASELLGLNRGTLRKKLRQHNLL